jgi:hypothetical protein
MGWPPRARRALCARSAGGSGHSGSAGQPRRGRRRGVIGPPGLDSKSSLVIPPPILQLSGDPCQGGITNASVADQTVAAATTALLTGSALRVPKYLRAGAFAHWILAASKTAFGTAARTFNIRLGTTGLVGDASIIALAMPVPTANADEGVFEVWLTFRGPYGAAGIFQAELSLQHNGNTLGFAATPNPVIRAVSAGVAVNVANLFLSISLTTGAAEVVTFQQVRSILYT